MKKKTKEDKKQKPVPKTEEPSTPVSPSEAGVVPKGADPAKGDLKEYVVEIGSVVTKAGVFKIGDKVLLSKDDADALIPMGIIKSV